MFSILTTIVGFWTKTQYYHSYLTNNMTSEAITTLARAHTHEHGTDALRRLIKCKVVLVNKCSDHTKDGRFTAQFP